MSDGFITSDLACVISSSPTSLNASISSDPLSVSTSVVSSGPAGSKGEKGDRGEKGDAGEKGEKGDTGIDLNYVHFQSTPSKEWLCSHNLGKFTSVTVMDSAGNIVEGDTVMVDINTSLLKFDSPFSGQASFN